MKNATKYQKPSKKAYTKRNRELKRQKRAEAEAAPAAAIPVPAAVAAPAAAIPVPAAAAAIPIPVVAAAAIPAPVAVAPAAERERRQTVLWTPAEEAKLKELLLKHTQSYRVPGPWSKMLREGKGVFNKCRTSVDLRDKWTNILPHWLAEEKEAQKLQNQA